MNTAQELLNELNRDAEYSIDLMASCEGGQRYWVSGTEYITVFPDNSALLFSDTRVTESIGSGFSHKSLQQIWEEEAEL